MATIEGGWRRLISEIGVEFLHDDAVELFRAGRPADRGPGRPLRPRLRARAGRQGPVRVRPRRPQPRPHGAGGRPPHVLRADAGAAVRSRGRPAARGDAGRLPAVLPAVADVRPAGYARRPVLRAERPAARLAPPRHAAGRPDADRQAVHGRGDHRRGGARHAGDDRHPVRPRRRRPSRGARLRGGQRQLAAALRHADAGGDDRLRRGRAGERDHAVPADGRDGAGIRAGGARAADGRGAGRARR